jgi:hypothetical protein
MQLEKAGIPCYKKDEFNKRTPIQSPRDVVYLKDCLVDAIRFEKPAFKALHAWMKNKSVVGTKEVLTNIPYDEYLFKHLDPAIIKFKGLNIPDYKLKPKRTYTGTALVKLGIFDGVIRYHANTQGVEIWADNLTLLVDGFPFVFGTGGIHGSVDGQTIISDILGTIYDWDVASFYPNLAIVFKLFPEHLTDKFCKIFLDLYKQRKASGKGTDINAMLKLALNGVYGDSNNQYSPFYDPKFMLSITMNGQLLLCMLAEQLMKIKGLKTIQINTDGVTVKCPNESIDFMKEVCKWWENTTKLELESAIYSKMFIKNVNAYIGLFEDGSVKRKKSYALEWRPEMGKKRDLEWHQNMSALVVPMAAEAYLLYGTPIEQFIYAHPDKFDFMIRAKVPKSSKLMLGDVRIQSTSRIYVALTGSPLVKVSPPTKGFVEGQWKRKNGLSDSDYYKVMDEISNYENSNIHIDTTGRPWDERINTISKGVYIIRRDGICAGNLIRECNKASDFVHGLIDYSYYIEKAYKLVDPLANIEDDELLGGNYK